MCPDCRRDEPLCTCEYDDPSDFDDESGDCYWCHGDGWMEEKHEYRVVWKREGLRRKARRYARLASAQRHLNLITSDEPWRYYGEPVDDPDERCCDGRECGCGGETERQRTEARRAEMPPLEYARVESRPVGVWLCLQLHVPAAPDATPREG